MNKTFLTLSTIALLASPSLFAVENSLQEHLKMEQKLKQQERKRIKDGKGEKNRYEHQSKHQYQYNKGINPNRSSMGSMNGQRNGGGRR